MSLWAFGPRNPMKNSHGWRRRAVVWHVCAPVKRTHTSRQSTAGRMRHPGFSTLSPWASGPRKLMKNGHNDTLEALRAIPFIFNADSFGAAGFSRLRSREARLLAAIADAHSRFAAANLADTKRPDAPATWLLKPLRTLATVFGRARIARGKTTFSSLEDESK